MPDIRAMCAIGRRGQLGLNGRMPWEGARGPEYTADVRRFFELTRGHVILLGPRTYRSVPAFAHEDRTVVAIRSSEQPADVVARFPDRVIYIGGGPPVWTEPVIDHSFGIPEKRAWNADIVKANPQRECGDFLTLGL